MTLSPTQNCESSSKIAAKNKRREFDFAPRVPVRYPNLLRARGCAAFRGRGLLMEYGLPFIAVLLVNRAGVNLGRNLLSITGRVLMCFVSEQSGIFIDLRDLCIGQREVLDLAVLGGDLLD